MCVCFFGCLFFFLVCGRFWLVSSGCIGFCALCWCCVGFGFWLVFVLRCVAFMRGFFVCGFVGFSVLLGLLCFVVFVLCFLGVGLFCGLFCVWGCFLGWSSGGAFCCCGFFVFLMSLCLGVFWGGFGFVVVALLELLSDSLFLFGRVLFWPVSAFYCVWCLVSSLWSFVFLFGWG